MKIFTSTFLVFLVCISLFSQPAIKWQKNFGGSSDDQANDFSNYYDAATHIIEYTNDGGFIMTGYSSSNDIDVSGNHGLSDFMLIKADVSGTLQWSHLYGGTNADEATSVISTSDGGYAIGGFSSSNDGDFPNNHGGEDVVIVKVDSLGNLQWQQSYGGTGSDRSYSFRQTADGGYVVGAFSLSSDGDLDTNRGSWDYWVFKTDSAGVIQWSKTFGGSTYDWSNSIRLTSDGGYVVCGWTISSDGDISTTHGATDIWVVKLDSIGNLLWQQTYGGSGNEWGTNIIQASDGGFALLAMTESNDDQVSGLHGNRDILICKLTANGIFEWSKTIGGSGPDDGYDIHQSSDGGYMIGGATYSNDGDVIGSFGLWDYLLTKLDSSGSFQWIKTFGGSSQDYAMAAIEIPGGDILMAGNSQSNNFSVGGNNGGWDMWVVRLTSNYNTITGRFYIDANTNGIFDGGDTPLAHQLINESTTNQYAYTDSNGIYSIQVLDTGTFIVQPGSFNYYSIAPPDHTVIFSSINQIDSLNDFAALAGIPINDLQISVTPLSRFRPGFITCFLVNYSNVGTTALTSAVSLILDSAMTYTGADITPDIISGDTITWNNITIQPYQNGTITVCGEVDASTPISTDIYTTATIDAGVIDENPSDNIITWQGHVTGSLDPNDKSVSASSIYTNSLNESYLDYVIRFQNTGNDTAFTVVVRDTISMNLDMNTFQFISSSHPVNINYEPSLRILSFTYNNIFLADSNVNEPASHGYIHFRIKADSSLQVNDVVANTARIYFDFNQAVVTNTVTTQVELPTYVGSIKSKQDLIIYPNPTTSVLHILGNEKLNFVMREITIYDMIGTKVLDHNLKGYKDGFEFSVADLCPGIYLIKIKAGDEIITKSFVKN